MALKDYNAALVTGASSGIGQATVRSLVDKGIKVHAVARRADRLAKLAEQTGCSTIALDLRDRDALHAALGGLEVDILVNNAGIGRAFEKIHEADPADIDATIMTNVLAAVQVVRAVSPGMVARKRGHIVNIGSVAGLYPIASSVYGASKGAVHLLSRNLRGELRGSGVRVTEICPGRVATEFFDAGIDDPQARAKMKNTGITELTSEDVADAILYALNTPWHVNISNIEMAPLEQTYGAAVFTPVEGA